jgi:hypothetical protein
MKIVNENLKMGQSLVDKVWNDAMESAALHCEYNIQTYRGMVEEGPEFRWVTTCIRMLERLADEFRKEKR